MSSKTFLLSASVITDDPHHALLVSEAFNRVCLGLAFDGITTRQDMTSYIPEGDDDAEADGEDASPDQEERDATPEADG